MPAGPLPLRARRPTARAPRTVAALASVLASVGLAASPAASAQERPVPPWERRQDVHFLAFGSGLYSSVEQASSGRDGFGFDGGVGLGVGAFSLGAGYQRTFHGPSRARSTAVHEGLFVEPRVSLLLGYGAFTPYVAGRVVRVGRLFEGSSDDASPASPRGVQFGGGGGLYVDVSPNLSLDLGAMYTGLRLDDADALSADRRTTNGVLLRAGLVVRPGRRLRD